MKKFQPIIAPTTACEVETGSFSFVIQKTDIPAAKATVNAPPKASTEPNLPKVCEPPAPCKTAPNITKMEAIIAACLKRIIFEPTADPNTLEASLAPNVHPKKSPLDKKNKNINLFKFLITF